MVEDASLGQEKGIVRVDQITISKLVKKLAARVRKVCAYYYITALSSLSPLPYQLQIKSSCFPLQPYRNVP